jgi:hypothetical protein
MRKLLLAVALISATTPALADWNQRHRPVYRDVPRYHHDGRGFLLGLGAAAVLGSIFYFNGRRCWNELVGYDQWGNELVQRRCEY